MKYNKMFLALNLTEVHILLLYTKGIIVTEANSIKRRKNTLLIVWKVIFSIRFGADGKTEKENIILIYCWIDWPKIMCAVKSSDSELEANLTIFFSIQCHLHSTFYKSFPFSTYNLIFKYIYIWGGKYI